MTNWVDIVDKDGKLLGEVAYNIRCRTRWPIHGEVLEFDASPRNEEVSFDPSVPGNPTTLCLKRASFRWFHQRVVKYGREHGYWVLMAQHVPDSFWSSSNETVKYSWSWSYREG